MNSGISSAPISARRVVLPGLVEPEGLMIESGPLDAPGPGQLLVAVEATDISYAEQAITIRNSPTASGSCPPGA